MYSIFISISIYLYAAISNRKSQMEAQAIFLNLFTISCPFANGLNRKNRLAHLWTPVNHKI